MTKGLIRTEKADISITKEGHVHILVHENQEIDLDDIVRINAAKDELCGKNKYTVIFQAPGFGCITARAREFAASKACYKNAIAKAIVTNSLSGKLVGNVFIGFNRPPAPTRIFSTVREAAEWLNKKRVEDRPHSGN